MTNTSGVLIVVETGAGEARDSSLELVSAARSFGRSGTVTALVVGHNVAHVADHVARLDVNRTLVVDDPALEHYVTDAFVTAIESAIGVTDPKLVLISGTTTGRDLGPFLAARRNQECLSDCISIRWDGEALIGTRPVYQGKMLTDARLTPNPTQFAVIRGGAYLAPLPGEPGPIELLEVQLNVQELRVQFQHLSIPPSGDVNLEDADVVVVGGRGVGSAENFALIEELAAALNAPVGATRAITDLGWRPHYEQIGQTGKRIRPKLYIGVGVSGAVQHTVGMRGSETIVAINRDPTAPLFRMADIGVVGDLNEVVPALIDAVRAAKSK